HIIAYLQWAIGTVKLSTGVRAAVAAELERRGVRPPSPPPPRPPGPCWRCGSTQYRHTWQQDLSKDKRGRSGGLRTARVAFLFNPSTTRCSLSTGWFHLVKLQPDRRVRPFQPVTRQRFLTLDVVEFAFDGDHLAQLERVNENLVRRPDRDEALPAIE